MTGALLQTLHERFACEQQIADDQRITAFEVGQHGRIGAEKIRIGRPVGDMDAACEN
jgi:hypothetical protein